MGGVSDATCNKKSCVDKVAEDHYAWMHAKAPDRDFSEYERSFKEQQYDIRRNNPDRFPGGLIEDTPPPAPPIAAGDDA